MTQAEEIKNKLLEKTKSSAFLNKVSTTFMIAAAPLSVIGGGVLLAGSATVGLAILGLAAAALAVGVTTGYAASRVWQGNNSDNFEVNTRSTAKHLVENLKANNLSLTDISEHEQNCRADGRKWAQVVRQDSGTPQVQ